MAQLAKAICKGSRHLCLNHSSLDGFLFLRYMKILSVIALVGCCITWPILLPLHVHGGGTNAQLDSLTFGNVTNANY